jgi:dienelactone hydrolase
MTRGPMLATLLGAIIAGGARAEDKPTLAEDLAREIVGPRQARLDVMAAVETRFPRLPAMKSAAGWEDYAARLRKDVLEKVVFRGAASAWRDAKTRVEWLDVMEGGPGYKIKKLRYEALPGLWIPALLYEPEKLTGKVPVSLAVNGHDAKGKAAPYKQIRCINMAKRGMLVLNVEWFGMGQLRTEGFAHAKMNQLDLCGTSGVAPFYLAMKRGLDVLLDLPHADPKRVAVSGLSGGGWQTIFISSLDERVTLANPVAGYSAFRVKLEHFKDLGDSEQTPCDLATVADYTHLTALRAPRPTLLTYNSKDDCCFEAGYALPPLRDAALPIYKLLGKEKALRWHVNDDPGTHNFEKDNRQALYRMLGDFFFADDPKYVTDEIPCQDEVKSGEALAVELPAKNADFPTLALGLAKNLPLDGTLPDSKEAAQKWQQARRAKLREILRTKDFTIKATIVASAERDGHKTTWRRLRLDDVWSVPVVELTPGGAKGTAILLNDAGRKADPVNAERLLKEGYRVLAVDPFYFGESRVEGRDYLFALLLAAVGDRPLGVQASQLAAVARWARTEFKSEPVTVVAVGPRTSVIALTAAGLEEKAIGRLELHGALGSLKEIIEKNRGVDQMPELFCFGLLESFDVRQLTELAAPRPVAFIQPSERAKTELSKLKTWYATLGKDFDPLH